MPFFAKCDLCGDEADVKHCSGCHKKAYCSTKCQKRGWKAGHKEQCGKEEEEEEKVEEEEKKPAAAEPLFTGMSEKEIRHLNKKRSNIRRQHCSGCGKAVPKKKRWQQRGCACHSVTYCGEECIIGITRRGGKHGRR